MVATGSSYARGVDSELEEEVERSREPHARELEAPDRLHDERGELQRAAREMGNRGFTQLIARMQDGEGIMPGGLVHPDVEAAIAASHGGGRPLAGGIAGTLESSVGESFSDVRVHTDDHAGALARAVSARAFTVGNDIFFASGQYSPGTPGGNELIAHEVAHVAQQRGAPAAGPLTVSQPGDAMEREAEAVARDVTG